MNVTEIMPPEITDTSLASFSGFGNNTPEEYVVLGLLVLIFIVAPLLTFATPKLKFWFKWMWTKKILQEKSATFHDHLMENIHFYRILPEEQKKRFLERTTAFMTLHTFEYVNIEKEERMPLLISAAAVQLTFGLDEFLLDHFKVIYVLKEDYHYGHYNMPFMGHVDHTGIYLSWNNFLRGFDNYSDAHNVGIHEMAHALTYVNFVSEEGGKDEHFKEEFRNFSKTARPIFEAMQKGEVNMLDPYAATNYNEFWAVAVETFFEKSFQMRAEMPELYHAMSVLLRQDPLKLPTM